MQRVTVSESEGASAAEGRAATPASKPWGTSLDIYAYRSLDLELDECPRRAGWRRVDIDTGESHPIRCRSNGCPYCGPQNAWLCGGAIGLANPERFGTITDVGEDWQTIRARMNRLRYAIADQVGAHHWTYSVEANPKGTGHHAHFHQHGAYVPQRLLSSLARAEGCGKVSWIEQWTPSSPLEVVYYGVKGLEQVRYGLKSAGATEAMSGFLAINGGRLIHPSRGFWRGSTQRETQADYVKRVFGPSPDARYRVLQLNDAGSRTPHP